jgi:hypothetical protein
LVVLEQSQCDCGRIDLFHTYVDAHHDRLHLPRRRPQPQANRKLPQKQCINGPRAGGATSCTGAIRVSVSRKPKAQQSTLHTYLVTYLSLTLQCTHVTPWNIVLKPKTCNPRECPFYHKVRTETRFIFVETARILVAMKTVLRRKSLIAVGRYIMDWPRWTQRGGGASLLCPRGSELGEEKHSIGHHHTCGREPLWRWEHLAALHVIFLSHACW